MLICGFQVYRHHKRFTCDFGMEFCAVERATEQSAPLAMGGHEAGQDLDTTPWRGDLASSQLLSLQHLVFMLNLFFL